MEQFLQEIKELCLKKGVGYFLLDTSIPFEDFLLDYLAEGTLLR
jgi:hypothetical protein